MLVRKMKVGGNKMLARLLEFRESAIIFEKKYERYILIGAKFLFILIALCRLNSSLGYIEQLNSLFVNIALAIIMTILPGTWVVLGLGMISVAQIFKVSIEAGAIVGLVLVFVYLTFIRFSAKMGYFFILVPLMFSFNIPYVIPIAAGLFLSPVAIVPTVLGIMLYYSLDMVKASMVLEKTDILDMPMVAVEFYGEFIDNFLQNNEMFTTIVIFTVVLLITYFVSRLAIDYSWYIAIGVASLSNLIIFLIVGFLVNMNISVFGLIFGTIFSAVIVVVLQFFRCIVDYNRTELVQYEDDDYYYYVKAVPKIQISAPERQVKHIK